MAASVLDSYRLEFVRALAAATGLPEADVDASVKPAEPAHGDLTFPAFALAKAQKKAPPVIAKELVGKLQLPGMEVAAVGPYVNARFLAMPFSERVLSQTRSEGDRYGSSDSGKGKTVAIDYSSPNIAKPIGFHHIRTTFLGHAIANLYRSQGWRVEGINYLGDWGKQFGLVAVGFQEYGDPARRKEMGHLVEVYVKANARAEQEPQFDARARDFFRRMEANDPEAMGLWNEFRVTSLEGFKKVYERLGIHFEHYDGESLYQGKMDAVIDRVRETVGVKESDGALIVDMPPLKEGEPPVLLKKSDGSTLYATRDLAAAIDRHDRFKFDLSLYVVAQDQALHFRQFFAVLQRMNLPWAANLVHVNFGRIGGMSTRKGQIVLLTDVLDEAKNRAMEKVKANIDAGKMETDDPEGLAEALGLGAIVFFDLKNRRITDYTFDWEEVLSFEGHTGIYVQYAHARTANVLRKSGLKSFDGADAALLTLPEEQTLIREISRFPRTVREAMEQNEPSLLARLLLDIAAAYAGYYTLGNKDRDKRILLEGEDKAALRSARLMLTDAVRITLKNGLSLLGIASPENM